MKLRRLFASLVSACVALSAMTVVSSAVDATDYMREGDANGTVFVLADKEADPNWSVDTGISPTEVYGVTYHVEFSADEVADEAAWIGGGIGANSQSTGWKSVEWGRNEKEIIADLENGTITWLSDAPVFAETDTYCQFWLQAWGGTVTIKSADILGADGVVLSAGAAEEAPAEDAATGAFTAEFGAQFDASTTDEWPSFADQTVAFDYGKEATLKFDMGKAVKFGANYIAVNTNVPYVEGMTADITSFKLDGAEIEMGAAYLNNEGTDGGLRLTIANLWNSDIAEQPVDPSTLGEFQTIEITFIVDEPAAEEETTEDDAAEEDDAALEGLTLADCYNAGTVVLVADDGSNAYVTSNGLDITDVYGYRVTAQFPMAEVTDDNVWIGGGIGTNSNSTGWASTEWGKESGRKPIVTNFDDQGVVTLELVSDASLFAADDAYAQLWIQAWGGTMTILKVEVLGADGVIDEVIVAEAAEVEAPAEDETVEEAPEVEEAPATGDVDAETDSSKGSPDTGIEDVAVVAGLAIVAAGAVLVSKKRK